jgi:hypothetical protein
LAAAFCVLTVALLFGGFGQSVATADTQTANSKTADSISNTEVSTGVAPALSGSGEQVATAETQPTTATVVTSVSNAVPELVGSFGTESPAASDPAESQEKPAGPSGPMALGVSTLADTGGAMAVDEDKKGSDSTPTNATVEADQPVVISHSPVTDTSPEPNSPAAGVTSLTDDPPAEEQPGVPPVKKEVVAVEDSKASAQTVAAAPIGGAAQAGDVITVLVYYLAAVADQGAQLVNVAGDLLSMLGFPVMGDGAIASLSTAGGIGGSLSAGAAPAGALTQPASSRAVQADWPEVLIAPGDSGPRSSAGAARLGGVAASGTAEHPSRGLDVVLADGGVPEKLRSILQHTVDAVLAPLSLLALAALASPGVAGLVLLAGAGMFVGFRQARAASVLRAVGIARFVKSGPMGVVRSGGLVALHSRGSRTGRRQPSRTTDRLRPVA